MNIEQVKRNIPEQFNTNLSSRRMKTGDMDFNITPISLNFPYLMQLAKQMYKQGYPQGEGTFEYRDPEFRAYNPQIDWNKMFMNRQQKFRENIGLGASL